MSKKIEAILELSRKADTDQDWEKIDDNIKKLAEENPNEAGKFILQFTSDPDSRVRDTTATILEFLDLSDNVLSEATKKMITQATTDSDIFASGRAATFLLRHSQNLSLKSEIEEALDEFLEWSTTNNWQEELISNIPNESLHQLLIKSK